MRRTGSRAQPVHPARAAPPAPRLFCPHRTVWSPRSRCPSAEKPARLPEHRAQQRKSAARNACTETSVAPRKLWCGHRRQRAGSISAPGPNGHCGIRTVGARGSRQGACAHRIGMDYSRPEHRRPRRGYPLWPRVLRAPWPGDLRGAHGWLDVAPPGNLDSARACPRCGRGTSRLSPPVRAGTTGFAPKSPGGLNRSRNRDRNHRIFHLLPARRRGTL